MNMKKTFAMVVSVMILAAASVFAQNAGDFRAELTKDGSGVRIVKYTGRGGKVVIPPQIDGLPVKELGDIAFEDNTTVTSVVIPEGITQLGQDLSKAFILPEPAVFRNCVNLVSVTLPNNLRFIGDNTFKGCTKLSAVTIPNGVTSILSFAFNGCSSLTAVTIPASVRYIGGNAFSNCSSLASVTIKSKDITIEGYAFGGNGRLTQVTVEPFTGISYNNWVNVFAGANISIANQTALKRAVEKYGRKTHDSNIADYTEAIRLNPNNADYYYERGVAYFNKQEYDRAIADFTQAIKIDPNNVHYYNRRGGAHYSKYDYESAIADFTQALRIDPNDAVIYSNRGDAYNYKQEYDRAIADCTEAIRINPKNAYAYNHRGFAYYGKQDYDRAMADYNQAITLNPNNAQTYARRGAAYNQKGQRTQAVQDLEKALSLAPNYQIAQDTLREIREAETKGREDARTAAEAAKRRENEKLKELKTKITALTTRAAAFAPERGGQEVYWNMIVVSIKRLNARQFTAFKDMYRDYRTVKSDYQEYQRLCSDYDSLSGERRRVFMPPTHENQYEGHLETTLDRLDSFMDYVISKLNDKQKGEFEAEFRR